MHGHHRRHHGARRPPVGARWFNTENVLERLEHYQRDLEQELADVSDLIKRLRDSQPRPAETA